MYCTFVKQEFIYNKEMKVWCMQPVNLQAAACT